MLDGNGVQVSKKVNKLISSFVLESSSSTDSEDGYWLSKILNAFCAVEITKEKRTVQLRSEQKFLSGIIHATPTLIIRHT